MQNFPVTWFESGATIKQIKHYFSQGKSEIRIASGFFTLRGWGFIRSSTKNKKVYLLVGIDEPGEERARKLLINAILLDLRTGLDRERRQTVLDLIAKIESNNFHIVDARATDHHAKLYIVDSDTAIVTSSNTTGKGLVEQIESGCIYSSLLVDQYIQQTNNASQEIKTELNSYITQQVAELIKKFNDYFSNAIDITQELLTHLKKWLELCRPWDIYLKTILALDQTKEVSTTYDKEPLIYQKDMISLALKQIKEYGGSMLVASTGLGKTVIGTWIAVHLHKENIIDNVIVLCPNPVKKSWRYEIGDASIHADYFTLEILDKKTGNAQGLDDWERIRQKIKEKKSRYLLIFDESHKLRKRYPDQFGNKYSKLEKRRERKAFQRINELVNEIATMEQVRVLLLTGSPYATDINNINVQLHLLPHTSKDYKPYLLPEYFDDSSTWKIEEPEDFTELPVAQQLTTPHVAKYYSEKDEKGLYVLFGEKRKYFPEINLFTLEFPLFPQSESNLEWDLLSCIKEGYFDLNIPHSMFRKNILTQVKRSWSSSPSALLNTLYQVVDTPGGEREYDFVKKEKSEFLITREERQTKLNPIIRKLESFSIDQDLKVQSLLRIIERHSPKEKIVIFTELYPTAIYLEETILEYNPSLEVFCTISKEMISNRHYEYKAKSLKKVEEAINFFAPVANNFVPNDRQKLKNYNIFITTDNYGIGVNMQDASVVINYDIAWTPIEPIQRAGRILRLWEEFRTVQVYTLIPKSQMSAELESEFLDIGKRWKNLMHRHEESRKLTDLPVLTSEFNQNIAIPKFAPEILVEKGRFTLENADDKDISPFFMHTRKLHQHRKYTQSLPSDLRSALLYKGRVALLFLLLSVDGEYQTLLFNPESKEFQSHTPESLLNIIECQQETPVAMLHPNVVEELSDEAIQKYCIQKKIDENIIIRECVLYLQPKTEEKLTEFSQSFLPN
ncbi:hypothetical protein NIES970_29310 (plasmid) [[Synechococcus] sp. NIES-970]|nr:hypothetical protein NIES970_29310 [[Synechococcus] sp. NIES-970]